MVRVHSLARAPGAFNLVSRPATAPGAPVAGGRFDSIDVSYAYLYAATTESGAFAETFARDLDYAKAGPRPLPSTRVVGMAVSAAEVSRRVKLVVAHGAGAQQLGQDDWLTRCDEDGYPMCREWAQAIKNWVPDADGLTWRSKRDPTQAVLMLWGSPGAARAGCGMVRLGNPIKEPLESGPARMRLDLFLLHWRLYLEP
ncbi:MAG: RES family NAD+ phosphorylase [Candidatus Dormibacteria bacterium]